MKENVRYTTINPLKTKHIYFTYKDPVRTAQ
jgi:hypothetical protein